ncbi:MAG: lysophospholipid acyltransferase family protein [Kineosporiaceae bacterium]
MIYRLARVVLVTAFRVIWRPEVVGLQHVPADGPVIIASNHLSFSDSVVVPMLVRRRVTFLAKSEYFTTPGLRGRLMAGFFTAIGAVPIRRTGRRDDSMDALTTAEEVLNAGQAFALYPEGTRSRDGRLYRGRTGVAWLSLATSAPVVPVALRGTEKLQPIGSKLPRLCRVRVSFAPPVDPQPYQARLDAGEGAGRIRRELTDAVMDAIAGMSGQERARSYNSSSSDDAEPGV